MNSNESYMAFYKQVFGGSWITQGISVAAELGIADFLANGPQTLELLADQTHSNKDALYRLLRALASVGIFSEDAQGNFSLTPLGDLLRSDVPYSQRAIAIMMGGEFHKSWGELLHSVQTGEPGFHKKFGVPFFQYMEEHPERHSIYDTAMNQVHGGETEPMIDAYDFSSFRTVVDVGGGNGVVLASILKRHPAIKGILFDLPAVADRAKLTISDTGVSDRLSVEGGSFFTGIPTDADAYVLRHIIHDWEDKDAIAILSECRKAVLPDGKILVVEMVIPPANEPGFGKWLDLMMLLVAGRERTQEEYSRLFSEAGLKMTRVIPTASDISIIEGVRT